MCLPSLPRTDLQREPDSHRPPAVGTVASVQDTEDKERLRTQQSSTACVFTKHLSESDERSVQQHAVSSTSLQFIPVDQQPPNSPVTPDVFQLAPFKTPGQENKMALSSSSFSSQPTEPSDVFLRAPFGKKKETTKAFPTCTSMVKSGTQPMQTSEKCHLVPVSPLHSPQSLGMRAPHLHTEMPLPQQPVAVHRVVSRVGQRAAVGSVAVGPLHSWTIGGRAVEDPFTAAPFQPRGPQQKPSL